MHLRTYLKLAHEENTWHTVLQKNLIHYLPMSKWNKKILILLEIYLLLTRWKLLIWVRRHGVVTWENFWGFATRGSNHKIIVHFHPMTGCCSDQLKCKVPSKGPWRPVTVFITLGLSPRELLTFGKRLFLAKVWGRCVGHCEMKKHPPLYWPANSVTLPLIIIKNMSTFAMDALRNNITTITT